MREPLVFSLLGAQLHKLTLHKVGKHLQAQKIQFSRFWHMNRVSMQIIGMLQKDRRPQWIQKTYHAEHQGDVRVSETRDHLGGHGQDEIASNRHLRTYKKYFNFNCSLFYTQGKFCSNKLSTFEKQPFN